MLGDLVYFVCRKLIEMGRKKNSFTFRASYRTTADRTTLRLSTSTLSRPPTSRCDGYPELRRSFSFACVSTFLRTPSRPAPKPAALPPFASKACRTEKGKFLPAPIRARSSLRCATESPCCSPLLPYPNPQIIHRLPMPNLGDELHHSGARAANRLRSNSPSRQMCAGSPATPPATSPARPSGLTHLRTQAGTPAPPAMRTQRRRPASS